MVPTTMLRDQWEGHFEAGMSEFTQILSAIEQGDPRGAEQLLPLVYDELRKLAAQRMAQEAPHQTLQATALVHEAYVRLVGEGEGAPQWNSRGHFFGAAAEAMRRILIERARQKDSLKRGGEFKRIQVQDVAAPGDESAVDLLDLNEALIRFERDEPQKAELVKLRFFAGLSVEEAAEVLGISVATAKRHWAYARAWLFGQISRK